MMIASHFYLFFSKAYKVGLYGPKIVWVFTGWYSSNFWSKDLHEVDCTEKQMAAVAEGTLVTSFYYQNPDPVRGVANMTGTWIINLLVSKR